MNPDLSQHPLAQPTEPVAKTQRAKKPEVLPAALLTVEGAVSAPDPSQLIELKMVRSATLVLDQQDAAKALVLGRYMANGGGVDGVVTRMVHHPCGAIVVTVSKQRRSGDQVTSTHKYIVIQGDLECEVL